MTRVLALALALTFAGCGGGALSAHLVAAETVDGLAKDGRVVVLMLREDDLRRAARVAQSTGGDVFEAVREAGAVFDAGGIVDAYNAFVEAKNVYVLALLAKARERRPSLGDLIPIVGALLRAYDALREALGEQGERLPEIPAFLRGFVSS